MREFFIALKDEYDSRCAKELQKKHSKIQLKQIPAMFWHFCFADYPTAPSKIGLM